MDYKYMYKYCIQLLLLLFEPQVGESERNRAGQAHSYPENSSRVQGNILS